MSSLGTLVQQMEHIAARCCLVVGCSLFAADAHGARAIGEEDCELTKQLRWRKQVAALKYCCGL
eukprot:8418528-Karenia_brevis.AAC.1